MFDESFLVVLEKTFSIVFLFFLFIFILKISFSNINDLLNKIKSSNNIAVHKIRNEVAIK